MKIFIFAIFFLLTAPCFAEVKVLKSYDDFPQEGILASSGSIAGGGITLSLPQLPMGMAGQPVPLTGSLKLSSANQWEFTVRNNADRPIKAAVELIQYNTGINQISVSKFTYKLKAGQGKGGKVTAVKGAIGSSVSLKNWSWIE